MGRSWDEAKRKQHGVLFTASPQRLCLQRGSALGATNCYISKKLNIFLRLYIEV